MPANKYDPDERFGLYPMTGEEVLETLLGTPHDDGDDEDTSEDEDS